MAFIPLMIFGCFYFPMALLAVGMTDNIFSLNPFVVMPSILKIFPSYLVACLVLGFLAGVSFVTQLVMSLIPVPFLPSMITGFLAIYFFIVEMRILGVMYYTNRSRLGWFTR